MRTLQHFAAVLTFFACVQVVRCAASELSDGTSHGFSGESFIQDGKSVASLRSSPPSEVPMPHDRLIALPHTRPDKTIGTPNKAVPIAELVPGLNVPPPHRLYATKRPRGLTKGDAKVRRTKLDDMEQEAGSAGSAAASDTAATREEGERSKRKIRVPSREERARKLRQAEASAARLNTERAVTPPVQAELPQSGPRFPPGFPGRLDEQMQQAGPSGATPDPFLEQMFESYRTFRGSSTSTHPTSFRQNGLRYGYIPSVAPLAASNSHLPESSSARVLLPQDVRWVFAHSHYRQQAYEIARDTSKQVQVRKTMAAEAKRLYEMEARNIRNSIENRGELPLDTSDEWRHWLSEHAIPLLLNPTRTSQPVRLSSSIINARSRLALRIQHSSLPQKAAIALNGESEKWAANLLVTWWTSTHDRILDSGLEHVH